MEGLRPCLVNGKKAYFHQWSDISKIYEPSMMIGGHPGGVVKYTVGIVEYEDGQVQQCLPQYIKFTDERPTREDV